VDVAQGEAKHFTSVQQAYHMAPDVTAKRLYIETIEDILKNSQKVVIDPEAKGVVPYMALPDLKNGKVASIPAQGGK